MENLSTFWKLFIDIGMYVTYALLGVAALGAIFSAVRGFITNPKGIKSALLGLVAIAAVFGISIGLSSGTDISEVLLDKTGTPQGWVRWIGAGLFSFYILFACTVVTVIATEVIRPSKK
jgi:ribose/xylose/arabinose/galactoside ABC-type transport system permease subunit